MNIDNTKPDYTIRGLLIQIKDWIEPHLNDLIAIHDIYAEAEDEVGPVDLFYRIVGSESIYEIIPKLKDINVYNIALELKTLLMRLFYESGFRKDIFAYDHERMDLMESLDESIDHTELLTVIFDMGRSDESTLLLHLLNGKFIQAYKLLKHRLSEHTPILDNPIMSQYQRALNHLYNQVIDANLVNDDYEVLNRLIKKERSLRPLYGNNDEDHRILCPTCKTELFNQTQLYCMVCGQKVKMS